MYRSRFLGKKLDPLLKYASVLVPISSLKLIFSLDSNENVVTSSTLCLKKGPTFKLSVTLSNLNRFSKLLHCWKAYEICYKTHMTSPTSP